MVEHDLAKVGAASSTLVSRSILLLFLFSLTLFSSDEIQLKLEDSYTFTDPVIYSQDIFPELQHNFQLFEVPSNIHLYKIRAEKIVEVFKNHGFTLLPNATHIVAFKKEQLFERKKIEEMIRARFLDHYRDFAITVESIDIQMVSFSDLEGFSLHQIHFNNKLLERSSGNFNVEFRNGHQRKKIYFRFRIKASLQVYKAKMRMYNNTPFTYQNVYMERIFLKHLPALPATDIMFQGFSTNKYVAKDAVITHKHLKKIPTVRKKSALVAVVRDGAIRLEIEVTAMEDGYIGDIIKVKSTQGKMLRAKVIATGMVEVL